MLNAAIERGNTVSFDQLAALDDGELLQPPPSCDNHVRYYRYAARMRARYPGLEPNSSALRWEWSAADLATTAGRVKIVIRYLRGLWSLDVASGAYRGQLGVDYCRRWLATHERPGQFAPLASEWRLVERSVGPRNGRKASPGWRLRLTVDDTVARASRPPGKVLPLRRRHTGDVIAAR